MNFIHKKYDLFRWHLYFVLLAGLHLFIFNEQVTAQPFWQPSSGPSGGFVSDIQVNPSDGVLYALVNASPAVLYRSDDTGMNWQRLPEIPASAFALTAAVVHHKVPAARSRFGYFRSRCTLEGRSKAIVSMLAGTQDGLSTESSYALRVLPSGVVRGIRDTLGGDPAGIRRSGAIVVGLVTTTASYARARGRLALHRRGEGAA